MARAVRRLRWVVFGVLVLAVALAAIGTSTYVGLERRDVELADARARVIAVSRLRAAWIENVIARGDAVASGPAVAALRRALALVATADASAGRRGSDAERHAAETALHDAVGALELTPADARVLDRTNERLAAELASLATARSAWEEGRRRLPASALLAILDARSGSRTVSAASMALEP